MNDVIRWLYTVDCYPNYYLVCQTQKSLEQDKSTHKIYMGQFDPFCHQCWFFAWCLRAKLDMFLLGRSGSTCGGGSGKIAATSPFTGVPGGSVLCSTYPVGHIISSMSILHQQYTDDTQLFISPTSSSRVLNVACRGFTSGSAWTG